MFSWVRIRGSDDEDVITFLRTKRGVGWLRTSEDQRVGGRFWANK